MIQRLVTVLLHLVRINSQTILSLVRFNSQSIADLNNGKLIDQWDQDKHILKSYKTEHMFVVHRNSFLSHAEHIISVSLDC